MWLVLGNLFLKQLLLGLPYTPSFHPWFYKYLCTIVLVSFEIQWYNLGCFSSFLILGDSVLLNLLSVASQSFAFQLPKVVVTVSSLVLPILVD